MFFNIDINIKVISRLELFGPTISFGRNNPLKTGENIKDAYYFIQILNSVSTVKVFSNLTN